MNKKASFQKTFQQHYLSAKQGSGKASTIAPITIQPVTDLIAREKNIECKPGCTFCCHLRVAAYHHEVIGIFQYLIETKTEEDITATRQRIADQYLTTKDLSPDERRAMNVACPLLADGLCSVHPVRPLACASHHSTDAWLCRDAFLHPEVTEITYEHPGIPMIQSIKAKQAEQEKAIQQDISDQGDDPTRLELISALHTLFENPAFVGQWQVKSKNNKNE